jgi:butyrate kinase
MATSFPSGLDSFTNPTAVDTLDSPPHDTQHADANDAIEALQAKVGVDGSAVTTSHEYRINSIEELNTNAQVGTTYTLALTDDGKVVEMNNASANTLTVPPNSSVAFPVGSQILVLQTGAGQTTVAAGAGVTVNSKDGNLKLSAQWCAATLIKRATDVWVVVGDLSA